MDWWTPPTTDFEWTMYQYLAILALAVYVVIMSNFISFISKLGATNNEVRLARGRKRAYQKVRRRPPARRKKRVKNKPKPPTPRIPTLKVLK